MATGDRQGLARRLRRSLPLCGHRQRRLAADARANDPRRLRAHRTVCATATGRCSAQGRQPLGGRCPAQPGPALQPAVPQRDQPAQPPRRRALHRWRHGPELRAAGQGRARRGADDLRAQRRETSLLQPERALATLQLARLQQPPGHQPDLDQRRRRRAPVRRLPGHLGLDPPAGKSPGHAAERQRQPVPRAAQGAGWHRPDLEPSHGNGRGAAGVAQTARL
ncbi:hypothetical protein D3C85_1236900 [compost metagenome]